jgi:hypothetical protein
MRSSIETRQEARRVVAATPIYEKTNTPDYEMILREASTTDPGTTFTILCATIQRLKTVPVENTCLEEGVKVHKTYLPRPRPRDTAAAMQTGGITGDVSAMRATPTGTAHDGLK